MYLSHFSLFKWQFITALTQLTPTLSRSLYLRTRLASSSDNLIKSDGLSLTKKLILTPNTDAIDLSTSRSVLLLSLIFILYMEDTGTPDNLDSSASDILFNSINDFNLLYIPTTTPPLWYILPFFLYLVNILYKFPFFGIDKSLKRMYNVGKFSQLSDFMERKYVKQ